jgi:hypothetical protein
MDAESKPPTDSLTAPLSPEGPSDTRDDAPQVEASPSPVEAAGPEVSHQEAPAAPESPGLLARVVRWLTTDLDGR